MKPLGGNMCAQREQVSSRTREPSVTAGFPLAIPMGCNMHASERTPIHVKRRQKPAESNGHVGPEMHMYKRVRQSVIPPERRGASDGDQPTNVWCVLQND